ncbi:hypothetical protein DVH05_009007 [Phytophthora capsici]|nr:hypothetical protein DVH05_009007 [Phytophthora capsici]
MKSGDIEEEYERLCSSSDYGQFSDDDAVEPVRPEPGEDGLSDDEESPHTDAAFIEPLWHLVHRADGSGSVTNLGLEHAFDSF